MNRLEKQFKINQGFRVVRDKDAPQTGALFWGGIALGILAIVGAMVLGSIDFKTGSMVSDSNQTALMLVSGSDPGGDSAEAFSAAHLFADQFFLTPRKELVRTYPLEEENTGVGM